LKTRRPQKPSPNPTPARSKKPSSSYSISRAQEQGPHIWNQNASQVQRERRRRARRYRWRRFGFCHFGLRCHIAYGSGSRLLIPRGRRAVLSSAWIVNLAGCAGGQFPALAALCRYLKCLSFASLNHDVCEATKRMLSRETGDGFWEYHQLPPSEGGRGADLSRVLTS
jgi:hypothetical protein